MRRWCGRPSPECITGVPNEFDLTVHGKLEIWTVKKWRETYDFLKGGEGFASRTGKFIGGKFWNLVNPNDGFTVADCEDVQAKRVLEFLIPVLYLEKPTRVIVTVGNTIFGVLLGERKVDWGIVLQTIVAKLVENVTKQKATPVGPTCFTYMLDRKCCFRRKLWLCELTNHVA